MSVNYSLIFAKLGGPDSHRKDYFPIAVRPSPRVVTVKINPGKVEVPLRKLAFKGSEKGSPLKIQNDIVEVEYCGLNVVSPCDRLGRPPVSVYNFSHRRTGLVIDTYV